MSTVAPNYSENKTTQGVYTLFAQHDLQFISSSLELSTKDYLVNLTALIIQSLSLNPEISDIELRLVTRLLKEICKQEQQKKLNEHHTLLIDSKFFSFYLKLTVILLSYKSATLDSIAIENDDKAEKKQLEVSVTPANSQGTKFKKNDTENVALNTVNSCTNMIDEANTLTDSVVDSGASNDLWVGTDDTNSSATLGLDYFDGFCSLFVFLEFLNNHAVVSKEHKLKNSLNIFAGQCSLVTSLDKLLVDYSITALNIIAPLVVPITLATTSIQFIIAAHDHYKATKMLSFEGWLEEKVSELNHINDKINTITEKLSVAENDSAMLSSQLSLLTKQKKAIKYDIEVRSKVYYHTEVADNSKKESILQQRQTIIQNRISKIHNHTDKTDLSTKDLHAAPNKKEKQHDANIQQQHQNNQSNTKFRLYLRTGALLSMSLLLIGSSLACPPLLIIASIMTYLLVTQFIYNYIQKIIELNNQANTKETKKNSPQPVNKDANKYTLFSSHHDIINEIPNNNQGCITPSCSI